MLAHNSKSEEGHEQEDRKQVTLYVVKATPTSGANTVKVMILLELLEVSWIQEVVASPSSSPWYKEVNPYKMVPGIEIRGFGVDSKDGVVTVFESSACLVLLAEMFDRGGLYSGRSVSERAQVTSWLMAYTAGLGATGKWWLTLKRYHTDSTGAALDVLVETIRKEYEVLELRLSAPNQHYIALPDRASIADFAFLPFTNASIAATAGIDFTLYPALMEWSERLMQFPKISECFEKVTRFGHD